MVIPEASKRQGHWFGPVWVVLTRERSFHCGYGLPQSQKVAHQDFWGLYHPKAEWVEPRVRDLSLVRRLFPKPGGEVEEKKVDLTLHFLGTLPHWPHLFIIIPSQSRAYEHSQCKSCMKI